ncbi:uncharacterized protein LOC113019659 isoform X4 [Astatotilapia calliptera]|uniref:uncharacterized protein LOC113019659 isoform X4 n=1 Tax=Astatotilapia calliptera TaxID=8154 RepID=UPI000E40DD6F|nr:uncharacterized protein LOC113019659 isoform X4 [Astatotilapia calliptera]
MGMLLLFLLIINVSQHALAVVEVNEGERSVLLLCLYSGFIPEDSTVMWTRSDLDPNSVHLRQEGGDNLRGQNQHYRGRTSMNRYALITNDFSLTLTKPSKTDSGNYTCSISAGGKERRLGDIQLQVKDQQVEVTVREGSESVILPCNTTPDLPKNTTVEWTRSEVGLITVHEYSNRNDDFMTQDEVYRDRTKMNKDLLRTGDLSLSLKYPTERDSGGYICTIYRDKDILRQKVVLQVKEPFPPWATALLVLLVLLVVFGCLLFNFRHYFMSVPQVEVDSGVESVQLPLKTIIHLPEKAKVEWKNSSGRIVHVYENGSDQPEEQNHCYKDRTEMNIDPLKPGDLSLTLKHPTDRDNSTYTCTVYSTDKKTILMKKQVELKVKVPLVEVEDSGLESVQLAHKATLNLPKDAKVEWTDSSYRMLHVYPSSSDQPEEQDRRYRGRTEMNEDLLKNGDLTLTLKHPTDWDRGPYTCTIYSTEGNILMRKQVDLKVGVCQVEVEEGAESVQLPFKTTENLPEDVRVKWRDRCNRKLHVYQNGWRAEEQHQVYRDRTKMNEDLLKTGDLSLTLKHPTVRDSGRYNCVVDSRNLYRYKTVLLKVKGRVQVQDQTGDIRNRSSSIDPTPLMADQSV